MRTDTFIQKGFYDMTDKTIIGQRIAELRKNLGLTQAELADKLGVSHQAVSQWERSETLPDILTLPRIAEVLGESISYILGIEETEPAEKEMGETDEISTYNTDSTIVYNRGGVRIQISKTGGIVEERILEMEDNKVEIPIDGGDYSIVLEKKGERVKIPVDLQERVTVILKGNCEDVSCDFPLIIEGDVEGDVSTLRTVSVGDCVNGDISTNGSVSIGGDANGDIDTNGYVTIGGDANGDIDTNSNVSIGGDANGDIHADRDIEIHGDLNGFAEAEGNIAIHGDIN